KPSSPGTSTMMFGRNLLASILLSGISLRSVLSVLVEMRWTCAISKKVFEGDVLEKTDPRSSSSSISDGTYPSNFTAAEEGDCNDTFRLKLSDKRSFTRSSSLRICSPLGNVIRTGGTSFDKVTGCMYVE